MNPLELSFRDWSEAKKRKKISQKIDSLALMITMAILSGQQSIDDLNVMVKDLIDSITIPMLNSLVTNKVGFLHQSESQSSNCAKVQLIRVICNQAITIQELIETV